MKCRICGVRVLGDGTEEKDFNNVCHRCEASGLSDEGEETVECPSECNGCTCHFNPPCNHCVEGHGEVVS